MLSRSEREERVTYYSKIFGLENIGQRPFSPSLWPIASYDEKIRGLTERGFKDPQKMITSLPAILGLSFENIDEKIRGLTERGFKDPQKMITSSPAILGYSFENIDEKIRGFTERGFKDPQKMITSLPAILGLSFENIDRKIKLCRRLGVDVGAFIAKTIVFVGMSDRHYIRILRKCRALGEEPTPKNVFRIYSKKIF